MGEMPHGSGYGLRGDYGLAIATLCTKAAANRCKSITRYGLDDAPFQFTAARRRLLSAPKSAKNQSNTTTLSLTCSGSREYSKYSARFLRHTSL